MHINKHSKGNSEQRCAGGVKLSAGTLRRRFKGKAARARNSACYENRIERRRTLNKIGRRTRAINKKA